MNTLLGVHCVLAGHMWTYFKGVRVCEWCGKKQKL